MFFFFGQNPNEVGNPENYDLDIFMYDDEKLIHISTAGMNLINSLIEFRLSIYSNLKTVLGYRRKYNFEVNPNIQRENLSTLDNYTFFFKLMSKRGFYSYDKVDIDDTSNYQFQLISKPIYHKRLLLNKAIEIGNINNGITANYNLEIGKVNNNFPNNFEPFDIRQFI